MFVRQSKYDELEIKYRDLIAYTEKNIQEANKIVNRINDKGGQSFLDNGVVIPPEQLK